MNTSAAIADPLLRRAFGRWACPSDPQRTVGTGALHFGACPSLMNSGTGTAADVGASPLNSARWSRDAAPRFRDEPSWIMRA